MFDHYYKDKKVLVLGHTGFKGAWLTEWLLQLGAQVSGVSSYVPSEPALFDVLGLNKRMQDYRCDIRDEQALKKIMMSIQPEIVFHLAAQPIVKSSYADPKLTFDTNLSGTVNVLEAVRSCSSVCTAIMITSDKCYDNVEWEYGYREDDRLGGKDPYSASKACAEIAIKSYYESFFRDSSVKIASVRAGNVIGGGDWAAHRIVPDCMTAWSNNTSVDIRSPHATRPWQHVLEPLSGYLWLARLLQSEQTTLINGESFNFGPNASMNYSVGVLIEALASVWGQGARWVSDTENTHVAEAGLLKLCCDKALHYLNWQPTLSFSKTVDFTALWYHQYYQGKSMLDFTRCQIEEFEKIAARQGIKWTQSVTQTSMV